MEEIYQESTQKNFIDNELKIKVQPAIQRKQVTF